jgi:hypothetical protein
MKYRFPEEAPMRWLLLFLSAACMTGCIVNERDGSKELNNDATPGNITFRWTFSGGATCAQTPSAGFIHIAITGPNGPQVQVLDSGGWFKCTVAGVDGIVLESFDAGDYSYTVDAFDGPTTSATSTFTGTGTVRVNGDVEADVSLTAM